MECGKRKLKTQSLTQLVSEAFWQQALYSRDSKDKDSDKGEERKLKCQEEIWNHLNDFYVTDLQKALAVLVCYKGGRAHTYV